MGVFNVREYQTLMVALRDRDKQLLRQWETMASTEEKNKIVLLIDDVEEVRQKIRTIQSEINYIKPPQ